MKKLNMMCPINFTGYGITSYNIYKELRNNLDICLFPIGDAQIDSSENQTKIVEDLNKQNYFDKNAKCFKIWHQFDLATRIGCGKFSALTFFEVDKLKQKEIQMIDSLDCIFVASNWAKQVLINNKINTPICVSPLGVDPNIFNNDVNNLVQKENNKYIFLNIGKWEIRKGHDILVDIFNQAFSENDNVELWMLNHNPFLTEEEHNVWINLYKNSKLGSKIKILPRINSHKDVAKLIALSDCGVFPARAEGWNNEVPEFFAINKPVILTNYSAHTEYANKDNSYLIDIDELTEAKDDKFFNGFGNWAKFSDSQIEQTIEYMRDVYKNDIRVNPKGLEKAKSLTWSNTANIIISKLFE
jgi:glycosyltransferase involved in cell wall biosynthesis